MESFSKQEGRLNLKQIKEIAKKMGDKELEMEVKKRMKHNEKTK
ncbi:hypothetical protein OX284_014215 [Flavobacterium sp. SUN046]|nr:hypothetical protein [Flavobacterium sp. SUN046]MEC4050590.1 hypothetical protein [Flavobacterium sp. SUN046]